ncbi:MAG: hypothetical protein K9L17_14190 [Clostridiales bacterium]|nr:hypothetical protein [Clostridiales bacterium]MCF8023819.1 hypothetical protein [Clostridiales bacterium]
MFKKISFVTLILALSLLIITPSVYAGWVQTYEHNFGNSDNPVHTQDYTWVDIYTYNTPIENFWVGKAKIGVDITNSEYWKWKVVDADGNELYSSPILHGSYENETYNEKTIFFDERLKEFTVKVFDYRENNTANVDNSSSIAYIGPINTNESTSQEILTKVNNQLTLINSATDAAQNAKVAANEAHNDADYIYNKYNKLLLNISIFCFRILQHRVAKHLCRERLLIWGGTLW